MSDNILEPNINGLPPITDWQKVFLVLQQANEAFLRGATLPELGKQIIGDVQIQGSDFVDLPVAETTDPVPLPIPETGNKFGFLADGKFTQPTGGTLEYSATQWGLTLFDGDKWVKKFTLDLPQVDTSNLVSKDQFNEEIYKDEDSFLTLEQGTLNEDGTVAQNVANRVRTYNYINATDFGSIEVPSTQECRLALYKKEGDIITFIRLTPYAKIYSSSYESDVLKIVFRNIDNSNVTPAAILYTYKRKSAKYETVDDINTKLFKNDSQTVIFYQGTIDPGTGKDLSSPTRLRTDYLQGDISKLTIGEGLLGVVYVMNKSKEVLYNTGYASIHENINIGDGFYRIILRKVNSSAAILPAEANVELISTQSVYLPRSEYNNEPEGGLFSKHEMPMFSAAPLGESLNYSLAQKTALFESILEAYPATWSKQNIGKSYNGAYDVDAYIITPDKYTVTIAVTAHVHGNERYNPVGFMALLDIISKGNLQYDFLLWIRENVRFIVVPFVSPVGYVNNTRPINGVNLNRNMDYNWGLVPPTEKGTAPMSMQENQNIQNFFMPLRDEIDFHIDCHDIPASPNIAIWYFNNEDFVWLKEQNETEDYLIALNETHKESTPYTMIGGTYTQYFTEVLGIPSTTPEYSSAYWRDTKKVSLENQIGKATEQICSVICMFANLHERYKGSPFYKKLIERSFCSEQFGIRTWTFSKLHTEISAIPGWVASPEIGGFVSYTLAPGSFTKTILVLSGINDDDKNSALSVKQVMQEIVKDVTKSPMYVNHLKTARIVVVPVLNESFAAESTLVSSVTSLVSKYSPTYTLVVRGVKNSDSVKGVEVKSSTSSNFTRWTRENKSISVSPAIGVETAITGRYSVAQLNNHIVDSYRYAHGVVRWIEMIVNDIASYNKE